MCSPSIELHGLTSGKCRGNSFRLIMLLLKTVWTEDITVFSYTCCADLLQNLHCIIKKKLKALRSSVTQFPYYILLHIKENVQNVDTELQHSWSAATCATLLLSHCQWKKRAGSLLVAKSHGLLVPLQVLKTGKMTQYTYSEMANIHFLFGRTTWNKSYVVKTLPHYRIPGQKKFVFFWQMTSGKWYIYCDQMTMGSYKQYWHLPQQEERITDLIYESWDEHKKNKHTSDFKRVQSGQSCIQTFF